MKPSWLIGLAGAALVAHGAYIPAKAAIAQVMLDRAWDRAQAGGDARPWPWADTEAVGELEVGGERVIVLRGATGEAMAFGPGLMEGVGSPVISAHRDTHFRVLEHVEVGDDVVWRTLDGEARYRIAGLDVVATPEAEVVTGALTLTTCWPFGGLVRGPERLIVTALPV